MKFVQSIHILNLIRSQVEGVKVDKMKLSLLLFALLISVGFNIYFRKSIFNLSFEIVSNLHLWPEL